MKSGIKGAAAESFRASSFVLLCIPLLSMQSPCQLASNWNDKALKRQ